MLESCYSRVQCSRIDIAIDEMWMREDEEYFDLCFSIWKRSTKLIEDSFKLFENYGGYYTESGWLKQRGYPFYFWLKKVTYVFNFTRNDMRSRMRERISVEDALLKYGIIYNR